MKQQETKVWGYKCIRRWLIKFVVVEGSCERVCGLQTACWWVMRPIKEVRQQGQSRRALTPDSRSARFLRQTRKQHSHYGCCTEIRGSPTVRYQTRAPNLPNCSASHRRRLYTVPAILRNNTQTFSTVTAVSINIHVLWQMAPFKFVKLPRFLRNFLHPFSG